MGKKKAIERLNRAAEEIDNAFKVQGNNLEVYYISKIVLLRIGEHIDRALTELTMRK